jgi:hypothetical protein
MVRKITNGQLFFEDSGKRLIIIILSILKDLTIYKYSPIRSYNRRV